MAESKKNKTQLYSAALLDSALPVKKTKPRVPKAAVAAAAAEASSSASTTTVAATALEPISEAEDDHQQPPKKRARKQAAPKQKVTETIIHVPPPSPASTTTAGGVGEKKPKRQMSEKQLAAMARGREARLQKKLALETPLSPPHQQQAAVETVSASNNNDNEEQPQPKPKKPRVRKDPKEPPMAEAAPEAQPQKAKRAPRARAASAGVNAAGSSGSDDNPPKWFTKFITNARREEARSATVKKPASEVVAEAEEVAKTRWKDPLTRDRINNENGAHLNRMYSMMFGRR